MSNLLTTIKWRIFSPLKAHINTKMLYPDFWIKRLTDPEKIIMSKSQIGRYNEAIIKNLPETVYDLNDYPNMIKRENLLKWLNEKKFPQKPVYLDGRIVKGEYYYELEKQLNYAAIPKEVQVKYGFTIKRTDLRSFPTSDRIFEELQDIEYDLWQETAVEPAEPLIILHQSLDKAWLYVQIYNYRGWVDANALALSPEKTLWSEYLNETRFLVITGAHLDLGINPHTPGFSNLSFQMGTKIRLANPTDIPKTIDNQAIYYNHVINLPTRSNNGLVEFKLALVPLVAEVSVGYLPYTRAKIITNAFKWESQRYGWGGMFDSVDCSALINNVYRTFGINLPRNVSELAKVPGKTVDLSKEKRKGLRSLLPGASLQFPGHSMLYLGEVGQYFYVIHALAGCADLERKEQNGKFARLPVNQVVITDLTLLRTNEKTLYESLVMGKQFER